MTDSTSPRVRIWARSAADWALEHSRPVLSPIEFAATVPGCAPGLAWAELWSRYLATKEANTIGSLIAQLNVAAERQPGARSSMISVASEQLTLDPTLRSVWRDLQPEKNAPLETRLLRADRDQLFAPYRLWDRLIELPEFCNVLTSAGLDPTALRPLYRDEAEHVETADSSYDSYPTPAKRLTSSNERILMTHRELRWWLAEAESWTRSRNVAVLTTTAFAATAMTGSVFWVHNLAPRLRKRMPSLYPVLAALQGLVKESCERESASVSEADIAPLPVSVELSEAYDRLAGLAADSTRDQFGTVDVHLWACLSHDSHSTFSRLFSAAGLDIESVREIIEFCSVSPSEYLSRALRPTAEELEDEQCRRRLLKRFRRPDDEPNN